MAKKPPSQSGLWTPFTAFPNALIDGVMPTLKDTEWRLICVIVRQTLGWSDGRGKRKERDWLTQRQLMKRTGRNSAALSGALDALVRRRLVDAWDETGEPLLTPQERRRYRGRIYFGLCRNVLETLGIEASTAQPVKNPLHKANRTKETKDKINIIKKDRKQLLKVKAPCGRAEQPLTIHTGWLKAERVASSRYFVPSD